MGGGACQAAPACPQSLGRVPYRPQSHGDKPLEDRAPENQTGTESGDSVPHTHRARICLHFENEGEEQRGAGRWPRFPF